MRGYSRIVAFLLVNSLVLLACGGGGGGASVSATPATGLAGTWQITTTDGTNSCGTPTGSQANYTADIAQPAGSNAFTITGVGSGSLSCSISGTQFACNGSATTSECSPLTVQASATLDASGNSFSGPMSYTCNHGTGTCTGSGTFSGVRTVEGAGLGTLGGSSFTPADSWALVFPSTTCTVNGKTAQLAGLVIGFSSYAGYCSFVQTNGLCAAKANATDAAIVIVQSPTSVGAGEYKIGTYVTNGIPTATVSNYVETNGTCGATAQSSGNGGTVTISSVSATSASGTLSNLTFADGSTLNGSFNATACNYSVDLCALVNDSCTASVCVP